MSLNILTTKWRAVTGWKRLKTSVGFPFSGINSSHHDAPFDLEYLLVMLLRACFQCATIALSWRRVSAIDGSQSEGRLHRRSGGRRPRLAAQPAF